MRIQPDPTQPGLWINADWQPHTPGTFALIIGVSQYPHLDQGAGARAQDTYDLGQLYVSALTAYRFFSWLCHAYKYDGSPLAQCWLLLSPSAAEVAAEPHLANHTVAPTFQACEEAVGAWFTSMKELPQTSAQQSRAFFFFSGHGLEISTEEQILLPSDYLRPPASNLNRALSTRDLFKALAVLGVPSQFFFIDACRNDHQDLRGADIKGSSVLSVWHSSRANPERNAPIIYASTSGTQAWQPMTPADGLSLFGTALLDGLQAHAGFRPDCNANLCVVKLAPLHTFLRARLAQLLQERQAAVKQFIPLAGSSVDLHATITEVEQPTQIQPAPPSVPETLDQLFDTRFPQALFEATPDKHIVFGSEHMTAFWSSVRIYSLEQRHWLTGNPVLRIHNVARAGTSHYRMELSIHGSPGSHWLQWNDWSTMFACLLSGDKQGEPRYLVEASRDADGRVSRLEASLAPNNEGLLGIVAILYEKYRLVSVAEACKALFDMRVAELLLESKLESPLAATIAGLILLRARQWDLLHDWLRNLATWFPEIPDGPVLWVEQVLQQDTSGQRFYETVDWLLEPKRRGLPHTGEALGYAARQVDELLETKAQVAAVGQSGKPLEVYRLDGHHRKQIEELQQRLRQALRFFRSGSLFSVYAGPVGSLTPEMVLGTPDLGTPDLNRGR